MDLLGSREIREDTLHSDLSDLSGSQSVFRAWLLGEYGIFLFCSPRFWVVGVFFFVRAFLLGRLVFFFNQYSEQSASSL